MLRLLFLAVTAVAIVAVAYVVLPHGGGRPGVHVDAQAPGQAPASSASLPTASLPTASPPAPSPGPAASAPGPTTFVVRDAPPPPPAPPSAPPTAAPDLNAVMQRLRAAAAQRPDAAAGAADPAAPPAVITPATPPPIPAVTPPPIMSPPPSPLAPPPTARWTSVTGQGARWRMAATAGGYTVQIDLGGGRVADVHVAPAFANLDAGGMNQRVDYLKQTILQNFPPETASYTFARDGSVSLDP